MAQGRRRWFTSLRGREFRVFSCRTAPAGTAERARAAEAPGALEPAGQMPNTVKGVVDNEMSKPLML